MSTPSNKPSKQSISPDASKMYCRMMNEQHGATVMGMALDQFTLADRGKTIQAATMTKITLYDCYISYAVCKGDACEMRNTTIPFVPPLESEKDVEPRMEEIHEHVLAPDFLWLFKPLALLIFIVCSAATIAKFYIGPSHITEYIETHPIAYERVTMLLGSVDVVNYLISFVFYVSLVGHGIEACFVAYHCKKSLQINTKNTIGWFVLVLMVGYPIMTRFNTLLKAQIGGEAKRRQYIAKKKNQ